MFMVTPRTAKKWATRFRVEGQAGRSSRPHVSPSKTAPVMMRRIVNMRWRQRLGPVQIGGRLGVPASTVHAVLTRFRVNRLSYIDRVTGEPLRRYEHAYPGSMIHVDVTKFANIPDGGGHKFVSREQGHRNAIATGYRTGERGDPAANYRARIGKTFVHAVIDDHSRVAYAEICTDETATTAVGVLQRAVAWFAERGVVVERVLSDNGTAYRSFPWRDVCAELRITHKRTRPYRPQTNGKTERFHRTLADGWAYACFYESTEQRNVALPGWLHFYNHHRAHSAIGGRSPVTRLTNLPGHHNYAPRARGVHPYCSVPARIHQPRDTTHRSEIWMSPA